jgi:hypothetical protein
LLVCEGYAIISKECHFGVKGGSVPPVQAARQKNGAE